MLKRFWANETGATAIEYALIAAGICVAVVTAVMTLGESVQAMFETVTAGMQ